MISSTQRDAGARGLGELLRSVAPALNRAVSNSFREELKSATTPRNQEPSTRTIERASQVLGTPLTARHDLADASPARDIARVTTAPTQPATSSSQPAVPNQQPPAALDTRHPAVIALQDALSAAGVPTNGLDFQYVDDTVGYPGGSYQNRLITVTFPGGVKENYGADLVMRNPHVAAVEIHNLLTRHV